MVRYYIVEIENKDFVLASCPSYEVACKRLAEIIKTDRYLAKYYNWNKLPKYEIIESECE